MFLCNYGGVPREEYLFVQPFPLLRIKLFDDDDDDDDCNLLVLVLW